MKVRVRLFARARELVKQDTIEIDLRDRATVRTLRQQLALQYPLLQPLSARSAIAVNEEFAGDETVLSADAVVALLPPVSGG